ncbi:MAG: hypothetical protein ACFE8B_01180 [Candidatus Hermodarchaeota archaeon]
MGAGRIIAIIGGVVGILSIALYYVMPEIFSLWRIDGGAALTTYFGGFGDGTGEILGIPFGPESAEDIFLIIIAVLLIAGGGIAILGGLLQNKLIGIIGGIAMLAGPILLTVQLFLNLGIFDDPILSDRFLLWGSEAGVNWGVWIGYFMGIGGGILGIIGGALVD